MMENPARLAKKQKNEFLARMQSYLQPCGKVFLKRGDFLSDSSIDAILPKADVIFVNKFILYINVVMRSIRSSIKIFLQSFLI